MTMPLNTPPPPAAGSSAALNRTLRTRIVSTGADGPKPAGTALLSISEHPVHAARVIELAVEPRRGALPEPVKRRGLLIATEQVPRAPRRRRLRAADDDAQRREYRSERAELTQTDEGHTRLLRTTWSGESIRPERFAHESKRVTSAVAAVLSRSLIG